MPRIEMRAKTSEYEAMTRESDTLGERNDCVVKAFALAAGISYDEARSRAASHGRRKGEGMYDCEWRPMFAASGVELDSVKPADMIARYPAAHHILKHVTTHHPDRFQNVWDDGERYLF